MSDRQDCILCGIRLKGEGDICERCGQRHMEIIDREPNTPDEIKILMDVDDRIKRHDRDHSRGD